MQYYGTLGPACSSLKILEAMFRAGMTGVRLNLSHGGLEENGAWLSLVQKAAAGCAKRPEILIDLRGPELRIGKIPEEIPAQENSILLFGEGGLPVPAPFLSHIEPNDTVLLDDGRLEFVIQKNNGKTAEAKVCRGGMIKPEKSLAVAGKTIPMPALTDSDRENIRLAAKYGVTGVMQPFVRSCGDLMELKEALRAAGAGNVRIFAKIENMQGVRNLEELFPAADEIVIARGDLGNAMPLWELPGVQKELAARCRKAGKPFMVVTQLLDSMERQAVPTRAEVLDICNAVLDGASSLMLTGETAAGRYPAAAMEYLVKTGEAARKSQNPIQNTEKQR